METGVKCDKTWQKHGQKTDRSSMCKNDNRDTGTPLPSRQTIVQPKLELTTPGDSYEREADRMADFVMRRQYTGIPTEMPSAAYVVHPTISRSVSGSVGVAVDTATEGGINASRGGGQPMPEALRSQMESGFGTDFSGVRLHTDSRAADLSQGIQAKAFTYGNDIYFNRGQYCPDTTAGQHLIAHELTHVVQQSGKVGRYRNKSSFNFGVADNNIMKEDEFNINIDEKTKPYIELITIVFDKIDFDNNGNPYCRGIGGVKYKYNPNYEFVFPISGGGDILGNGSLKYFTNQLKNGSFKVTDIKGVGFNSGTYTDFSEADNYEGQGRRYTKADSNGNRIANMSLAVFFNGGEALHLGRIDSPSHGCVHVAWDEMLKINYHSVLGITKVDIIYLDIEDKFSNLKKRRKQKHSSNANGQNRVQPKLELTTPGDSYEREADRMADFVMRRQYTGIPTEMPSAAYVVHPTISRSVSGSVGVAVSTATKDGINASRGGGQPMPATLRSQMESGFGTDFSGVRLHTDSKAADLSRGIQARAFTYGNDIYFNRGEYQPYSVAGQHLIAHELTHVVQQSGKVGRKPTWDSLNSNYPLKSHNNKDIFEYVFVNNLKGWENTCATRVSIAFIRSGEAMSGGFKVNKRSDFYNELKTKNEIHIIVGVREMKKWLEKTYGTPIIIEPKQGSELVTIDDVNKKIANKKGVLLMEKYHVTLWTGDRCIEDDYYPKKRVYFWEFSDSDKLH